LALWEPPLTSLIGESGAPVRRSALAETADLLADLVIDDRRTLAFVRSRRGAEAVATMAREHLEDVSPGLGDSVAAYRGGYLPEERRDLERSLKTGRLRGLATTNALELGVDVSGLDAVVIAGWPGTRASLWQQAGRAGRDGREALAVLVARDDPLDTYLVHHPEAIVGRPVEASVFDPANPYVLGPHLAAAAAELPPLSEADLELFVGVPDGDIASQVVTVRATADALVAADLLRRRAGGWYWTRPERATDLTDLRGIGGGPVRVVEDGTGRLLGTVDRSAADGSVHAGAVYVHQGITHEVMAYDPDEGVSIAVISDVDHTTSARSVTQWNLIEELAGFDLGDVGRVATGIVEVTSQVVSYLMRRLGTGEVIGERPLELPARTLRTRAVWYTLTPEVLERSGIDDIDLPGALHAAEHAAIGLLPLVATCDRWDIGGVSTALHPDTLLPTLVVYDGHPGGAGFAERGFAVIGEWLGATLDAIVACECPIGCPSCVQSPKCGNGNEPLDKAGAVRVLEVVLGHLPA
jgi:DEAD/DEAH box helicase domain-containing protein